MKVAVVQFKASTVKEENLKTITRYIREASRNGARMIAFPEFAMFYTPRSQTPAELSSLAEPITGDFVKRIADCAKENTIDVICTMYEKSPRKDRVYDTAFLVERSGKTILHYRKIHLYDALGFRESDKMTPGSAIPKPVKSEIGRLGMLVCFDLRFPEISRILASSGSEVLVAPSAWVQGDQKEDHWITLNKTRAMENGCYVIAPDQTGNTYCGRSIVVDPYGRVLLDMEKQQGIGYVEIDPRMVYETRSTLPLLRSRRTDVYPDLIS